MQKFWSLLQPGDLQAYSVATTCLGRTAATTAASAATEAATTAEAAAAASASPDPKMVGRQLELYSSPPGVCSGPWRKGGWHKSSGADISMADSQSLYFPALVLRLGSFIFLGLLERVDESAFGNLKPFYILHRVCYNVTRVARRYGWRYNEQTLNAKSRPTDDICRCGSCIGSFPDAPMVAVNHRRKHTVCRPKQGCK